MGKAYKGASAPGWSKASGKGDWSKPLIFAMGGF